MPEGSDTADTPRAGHTPRPDGGRSRNPRAGATVRQPPCHLAGGARAACQHHNVDREPAAGRSGFPAVHRRGAGHRPDLRRASCACHSVRHRNVARRTRQCALWRRIDRPPRHEPRARGARRGPRLRRRAGRHKEAAQRISARPGFVFSARSRRRCLARRHGGDALLRHQCGALRHHEGRGAGAEGGAGERRTDEHREPGEEIVGGLRPHAADGRFRRHARRDHRAYAQAAGHSGGDRRRGLPVRLGRGRLQCGDHDDPVGYSGCAHRVARRAAGQGHQSLLQARPA